MTQHHPTPHKANVHAFQERLLKDILVKLRPQPSSSSCQAFMKYPRHLFLPRFSLDHQTWLQLNFHDLETYLPLIYSDITLLLYEDEKGHISTISQPSFVLRMLDLLDLKPGQKVLEIGAGSGWNAALMGELVGRQGKVISLEIVPEMVERARACLLPFALEQVQIIEADGNFGYPAEAPFDRAVFTAGAFDLPSVFFDQIKPEGKLILVVSTHGIYDVLLVLEKKQDYFISTQKINCLFVPLMGQKLKGSEKIDEYIANAGPVKIYPKGTAPGVNKNEKLIQTDHSDFIFML